MRVKGQKSTRTTFPRRPAGERGGELIHDVAPAKDGSLPSTRRGTEGGLGCGSATASSGWNPDRPPIAAHIAVARSVLGIVTPCSDERRVIHAACSRMGAIL